MASKLPYIIIGGVAIVVGYKLYTSRKASPVDGSAADAAGTASGDLKPTPGSVLDGGIGAIKGVVSAFGAIRGLFSGGGGGTAGEAPADGSNEKEARLGIAPSSQIGGARDPLLTRENTRRTRGTSTPQWSTLWADNAVVGTYS